MLKENSILRKKKSKFLIINTGGTYNKIYNELDGKLFVPKNNKIVNHIIQISKISDIKIKGMIYKDSLDITSQDREKLKDYINKSKYDKIIIIHGTDTMDKTALYLDKKIKNKQIILTGSMKPFSIEPIEATSNLMGAYGFLKINKDNGIFISMHGLIEKHNKIIKNRELGIFECL